jgi:hypothetical protein
VKEHPNKDFTSEDMAGLFPPKTPITSIRRAVCNLKKRGEIIVFAKRKGMFNRNIFVYIGNAAKVTVPDGLP